MYKILAEYRIQNNADRELNRSSVCRVYGIQSTRRVYRIKRKKNKSSVCRVYRIQSTRRVYRIQITK